MKNSSTDRTFQLRDNAYTFTGRVRFSEVDHTRRMTLPAIINYFQDCSTFQSEGLGLGIEHCAAKNCAWILSSWQVVVNRYPKLGEEIHVSTWAAGFNRFFGDRNFCMQDKDGELVAYANSVWVYMDVQKGRPVRPEASEIALYGMGEPLEMEYASRKVKIPQEAVPATPIPVLHYHIDTNEHVNNCQYVQMALEVLPEKSEVQELRVEYKKSAIYGDIIFPKMAVEENRTVVELCDKEDNPYAVVEFHNKEQSTQTENVR